MDGIISYGQISHKELKLHKNRGMEIVLVTRGVFNWYVDGKIEKLSPGTAFFTLPWQVHGGVAPLEPGNKLFWVLFELDKLYSKPVQSFEFHRAIGLEKESKKISSALCAATQHTWPASESMKSIFPVLLQTLSGEQEFCDLESRCLLQAIIIHLFRAITSAEDCTPALSATEQTVAEFSARLEKEYEKDWTLEEMASSCCLKPSRFSSIVKKLRGHSPVKLLNRIRVDKAIALMKDPDLTLTQIALRCGINSSQHFWKIFQDTAGLSPKKFRAMLAHSRRLEQQAHDAEQSWRSKEEEMQRMKKLADRRK